MVANWENVKENCENVGDNLENVENKCQGWWKNNLLKQRNYIVE